MSRPFSKLPDRTELARELRRLAQASDPQLVAQVAVMILWTDTGNWILLRPGDRCWARPYMSVTVLIPIPLTASSTHLAMDIRDKLAEKRKAFFKEKEREEQVQKQEAAKSPA